MLSNDQDVLSLLRSLHSFEQGERDDAVSILRSLDRESTSQALLTLMRDHDPDVRGDAAEALMRIDSAQGTVAVLPLLSDLDVAVQWHACGLLYEFGDTRATTRLAEVLLNDPEGDVRFFAADALGRVGDRSAVSALLYSAQSDKGQDREGRRVSDAAREAVENIEKRHP